MIAIKAKAVSILRLQSGKDSSLIWLARIPTQQTFNNLFCGLVIAQGNMLADVIKVTW
jgi:hypothetical protein